jgi:hypothetical protein
MSNTMPVAPSQPAPPRSQSNGYGVTALILGIVTMVGFAIPFVNYLAILTGAVGVVFGIIGLVIKFRPRKAAIAGLILSGVGLLLSIILATVYTAAFAGAAKALEEDTVPTAGGPSSSASAEAATASFKDGVLTTPKYKIEITGHRVIAVGQPGNEYGTKPVIAIVYKTTNLTSTATDPITAWIGSFTATQDNDPNAVNTLDVGALPDEQYLDSQTQQIKEGGTVENAIAYELDDTTTAVELSAKDDLFGDDLGTVTYQLQ